ncbi:2-keto-4-pentenoate hydratase/2-oxohepta-3-ene-1,7-dioic acid hydratase in catechol pathway [Nocardioides luteus]|uniref:2-hydroxyhepta-2,4-diene-1,7-dioate isomerase n=1 Tax=Nocardioides luteus TaxID=1844 RepID=A0ABQ5SPQ4_9ACTN|nr:fumarylacetoacetate hydrolase family protein [Nocardioides luteus]MDR7313066.1 2-keto-4-pentenoate hydratase/2-oxohepta-3-ene-1,7-dioic acid hydratase in catechol pathway [Nocardioides luteus]GGR44357.1 2-hydroxyhepta-2,4-diene-1,7-dioate isomerase [Nocardioides luteus]GLJ66127.1 2-hydroxyhepta-2,4-diene-1,7-dioate isomerase [Nocardioides luteus]
MRIARIEHPGGTDHAVVEADGYRLIEDLFASEIRRLDRWVAADDARLLAPVEPRTVVGMAHNTGPGDRLLPPQAFLKPARSVIGPGEPVPVSADLGLVHAEAELAVVLGASGDVLGYTVANDVTGRDLQVADSLWTQAKGQRGFTPLGPWIETDLDTVSVTVGLEVDDTAAPSASTDGLARSIAEVVAWVSGFLPLGPGDVILTGAPGASLPIRPGQQVRASVAGIGELVNPVVEGMHGRRTQRGAA